MFYFRINKLKIKDNRERPEFLGIFGRDRAEVKLISFITTEDATLPDMNELLKTNDDKRKKEIIKAAIMQVVSAKILTTIENVEDNHVMTFGDTGYVLYRSDKIPVDFNWTFLAIECDWDVRKIGDEMKRVISHSEFDDFTTNLLSLISAAAVVNPSYLAAVTITKFIVKVVAYNLKNKKDDMIGVLYTSLNRREHYPHGERKKNGVWDLTNNMMIDYSIFAYED